MAHLPTKFVKVDGIDVSICGAIIVRYLLKSLVLRSGCCVKQQARHFPGFPTGKGMSAPYKNINILLFLYGVQLYRTNHSPSEYSVDINL